MAYKLYYGKSFFMLCRKLLTHATIGQWIDASQVGIWGWSYGGFTSAAALADDSSGTIRCALSVAPVTDWKLYGEFYFAL